jgi:hypothetical protein
MNRGTLTNLIHFDNILYIGDEAKTCICIIEKFNNRLLEIEQTYSGWFKNSSANDKLQHHIHYHFEGRIAAFKFKSEDDLPAIIRNECFAACKTLATEQFYVLS